MEIFAFVKGAETVIDIASNKEVQKALIEVTVKKL